MAVNGHTDLRLLFLDVIGLTTMDLCPFLGVKRTSLGDIREREC
jgi:hypothetical protein